MTTATLSRTGPIPRLREFAASVSTITSKELRSRFRGRRAFVVLTIYLAVLALIAYAAYVQIAPNARAAAQFGGLSGGFPNASATIGQSIFSQLSVFQLLLVAFLAPSFTTGAISLEREKATLDLLMTTPMRPSGIVVGKLISALAFVALLILAGVPVSALVLMYGGASIDDVVRQQVVLFVSAFGFGVIGLFYSALIKRTQTATVLTYSTILLLTIGTFLVWRFWTAAAVTPANAFGPPQTAPEQILYLNPAISMIEIVADTEITQGDFGRIMSEIRGTSGVTCDGGKCFPVDDTRGGGGGVAPDGAAPAPVNAADGTAVACPAGARCAVGGAGVAAITATQPITGHFWPRFAVSFLGLSLLLTLLSMRLVMPARQPLAFRRRRAASATATPDDDPAARP